MSSDTGAGGAKSLEELEAALEAPQVGLADLDHANPKRRRDALDRIATLGRRSPPLAKSVARRLDVEDNPYVLSRALSALGVVGAASSVEQVARHLTHGDARVVANAVEALAALDDRTQVAAVAKLLAHAEPRVRANAILYLAADAAFDAKQALATLVAHRSGARSALWAAGELAHREPGRVAVVELAGASLSARDPEVADRARRLLEAVAAREPAAAALLADASGQASEKLDLRPTSLSKRALAWLADSVLLGAIAIAALIAISWAGSHDDRAFRVKTQLVLLAYSIAFFMRDGLGSGRGLAKRWLGLRVVDLELSTGCGYIKSMIRQATFYLPGINFAEVAWAATDPEGCRIVDRLLGTMVVDERQRELTRFDRGLLVVLGVVFTLASGALTVMAFAGDLGLLRRWIIP